MKNKIVVVVSLLLSILATMASDWADEEQDAMKMVELLMKPTLATMASASMLATRF